MLFYCLSYTAVLVNFLPFGSVPVMVTVRVLPSADTTARPLIVTLSPFLLVITRVCPKLVTAQVDANRGVHGIFRGARRSSR